MIVMSDIHFLVTCNQDEMDTALNPDTWKHKRVYGTYSNYENGRFACEIHHVYKNLCFLTSLTMMEKFVASLQYFIPVGSIGSMMMLQDQIQIYENNLKITKL